MKRKVASGIMLTLLLIGMLTLAFSTQSAKAEPTTIVVPDDYERIQWAVGNATKGDTVFVRAGTYYEHVTIDKSISLIGENKHNTTIDGGGTGNVVHVTADNVTISGFTVTNAELKGIQVENSRYCEVHETIVCFTGDRGIVFEHGGNNTAYNNVVYNSSAYGAIEAIWSNNNTIYSNLAYFNQWGIATNHGSYNRIYNNTVHSNRRSGIHIDWPSTGNNVYNNNISSNTLFGIHVVNQANENIIRDNEISGNSDGIWFYMSSNNSIIGNHISNNDYGIKLELSSNNTFYHNNVTDNTSQVYITPGYANFWDNGTQGNYWSDYEDRYPDAEELDDSGIWDTPYVIDEDNQDNYPLMPPDTTSPTLSILSPENKTYAVNEVPLTFTVSEPTSWVGYSLDGQANVTITGNTTLSGLSDGSHTLIVHGKDKAGNTGASEMVYFSIEIPQPFPIEIAAAIGIIV